MNKQTVLITGASRGIGRCTALRFAADGYHVFLNCSRSVSELEQVKNRIEAAGGSCEMVPADVSNPDEVRSMFSAISTSLHGRALDVLINNAGIAHTGLLMDLSDEDWRRIIDTDLSSVFYCCRAAIPAMIAAKRGTIINVSSMWGTSGASCEAAYSAAKAGVRGLTQALAKELAPSNIPVNAIAPGVIDTAMNSHLSEAEQRSLTAEIPAGRFATPEEAAEAILRLAKMPAYLTGQIIGFDGGYL